MQHGFSLSPVKLSVSRGNIKQLTAHSYLTTILVTILKMKKLLHENLEQGTSPSLHFHKEVTFDWQVERQAAFSANK